MLPFTAPKLYPPSSPEDLFRLHQRIVESNSPDHYKQSLIYYLLKDFRQSLKGRAAEFAQISYLPDTYRIFVDGLWFMDRLKFDVSEAWRSPACSSSVDHLDRKHYHTLLSLYSLRLSLKTYFTPFVGIHRRMTLPCR